MDYRGSLLRALSPMFLSSSKYKHRAPHLQITINEKEDRIEVKYPSYMNCDINHIVKNFLMDSGCEKTKDALTESDFYIGVVGYKSILPKASEAPESQIIEKEPAQKKLSFEEDRAALDEIAIEVAHKKCLEDKEFFDFNVLEESDLIKRIKEKYPNVDNKAAHYIFQKAKYLLRKSAPKVEVMENIFDRIEKKLTELYKDPVKNAEDIKLIEEYVDDLDNEDDAELDAALAGDEAEAAEEAEEKAEEKAEVEGKADIGPNTKAGAIIKLTRMYKDGLLTDKEYKQYMAIQLKKIKKG